MRISKNGIEREIDEVKKEIFIRNGWELVLASSLFICPICNKEYKNRKSFENHISKCEEGGE